MWGGPSAFINGMLRSFQRRVICLTRLIVSFAASSQGQLAMVIYEWADAKYLGNATGSADENLPVSSATLLITF